MMMLLPSFNFIEGGKEKMRLMRNFHLMKVKQIFVIFTGVASYRYETRKINDK